jgi:uncharacterized pyridoxal phosphate-containing UPF0001 family protein
MSTTEESLYREAYNAHELAEQAALEAITEQLRGVSLEGLMCLADPDWGWEKRGSMSGWITDRADEVLTEKLESLVEAT